MSKISETYSDFKKFILKGNIIDMAVGVIVGGAFGKVITSLVNDVLMPIIGSLTGGSTFSEFKYVINATVVDASGKIVTPEAAIYYGRFLQNILDFLIIGLCMFIMIRAFASISSRFKKEEEVDVKVPGPTSEELLGEILSVLKDNNKNS
ncbi:MAG: large conductance mechanosensitive channel protein MscL [Erysipelotrichaceae bacterium]